MDRETMRKLVRVWDEAGPALEAIKRRELEAMTDDDVRAHVAALFTAFHPREMRVPRRAGSGLLEQQRWFERARQRP